MRFFVSSKILSVFVVALLSVGCGLVLSPEKRLERAEQAFAEGEYQAASLDLKRVLQDRPDNARARALLGMTFVRLNDPKSAETELRRAISLGAEREAIWSDLARSLALQGRYEDLLDEMTPVPGLAQSETVDLHVLRGNAALALQRVAEAREEFDAALAISPDHVPAALGVVSTFVQVGSMDEARDRVDALTSAYESDPEVWNASGSLHMVNGDPASAIEDFGTARRLATAAGAERAQEELAAISGIVTANLERGDIAAAREAIDAYRQMSPDATVGLLLEAQVRLGENDVDAAISNLEQVLKRLPDLSAANFLMGLAQYRAGNLGQSEAYLGAAVAADPGNAAARTTLAEVRGQLNDSERALDTLEPLLEIGDVNALNLAARLRLQSGDYDGGIELLRRRVAEAPDDDEARLDLAAALLTANRPVEARENLNALSAAPTGESAIRQSLIRILTTLADGNAETALAEADAAVERFPGSASLLNLRGRLQFAGGDIAAARASFRQAIEAEPEDMAAYVFLASLELAAGDAQAAALRYREALGIQPDNAIIAASLGQLEARQGNTDEAIELLERAVAAAPQFAIARMELGSVRLSAGDIEGAIKDAEEAVRIAPDNAQAHNLLGAVRQQAGDMDEAIEHFERAASIKPVQPMFVVNLARAQMLAGDAAEATATLQAAFDDGIRPPMIVSPLGTMLVQQGRLSEALAAAEKVESGPQSAATADVIRGDLYLQAGRAESAVKAYASALDAVGDWRVATRLAVAKTTAGQPDPTAELADYVRRNAEDQNAWFTLAQFHQQFGNVDEALKQYESLIRTYPNNGPALNNLAWLYYERGDSRALPLAERAVEAAPNAAAVADTLGWILVEQNETERGLRELQRALTLDKDNPDIRYHVAAALAKSGREQEAKDMLDSLLADEQAFPSRAEAEQLNARL